MLARCRPDGGKGGVLVGIGSWMDSESYTLSQGKNHAREMRKALPHPKKVIKRSGQIRTGQVRSGQVKSGQVRSGQIMLDVLGNALEHSVCHCLETHI